MDTLAEDVLQQFCTSERTRKLFDAWRQDARRRMVAPAVLQHRTHVVYALALDDVKAVCTRTEHALGKVRRADGEAVRAIVDWHPDFAFTHMFHICMERMQRVPTYQDFRQFADQDEMGRTMLGTPARQKVREVMGAGVPAVQARAAMRWRVGNAYYSFLREIWTVVDLRSRGVDLRVHPLADALFRVDAWVGLKALSLRIGNKKFRQGESSGRKRPPNELLADIPGLEFETIELQPATEFGSVHLPSPAHLAAAAALLRRDGAGIHRDQR